MLRIGLSESWLAEKAVGFGLVVGRMVVGNAVVEERILIESFLPIVDLINALNRLISLNDDPLAPRRSSFHVILLAIILHIISLTDQQ